METKKFSPKDAALIRKHPGASPDALLDLGLSKKAYARLVAAQSNTHTVIEPVSVTVIPQEADRQTAKTTPKIARLHNLRTGLIVTMSYKAATRLSAAYPNTYKLL
jgi:hypothetical protein